MDQALSDEIISSLSTSQSFERGVELYHSGALFDLARQGNLLLGRCEGSSAPEYSLQAEIGAGGVQSADCSCPYDWGGLCKHLVALLLATVHSPEDFSERQPVPVLLNGLDQEALVRLVEKLVEKDPDLYEHLELAAAGERAREAQSRPPRRKRKTEVDEQTYRRQVRRILNSLSGYRMSEAYWMMGGMVEQLRGVEEIAQQFLEAGEAEGVDLFGTGGESLQRRIDQLPGMHGAGPGRRRRQSEYANQLREKQKVKRMYGLREAQMRRLFLKAQRAKGMTGPALLELLERRLDNAVYRLGYARTRPQARQYVTHGHVRVDGARVNIPSYEVGPGQEIEIDPALLENPQVKDQLASQPPLPAWLERTRQGGRVLRRPAREDIPGDIEERRIVEFYSR